MFLERLKTLTKPFHDEVEHHSINQNLFAHEASDKEYGEFLQLQYLMFTSLEQEIVRYSSSLLDIGIEYHCRAHLAEKELKHLNIPVGEEKVTFELDDLSSVLAAVYLLEGSRHGAMVLLKTLRTIMPSDHDFLFLESNPQEFVVRWKRMAQTFEQYASDKEIENAFILNVCRLYCAMGVVYDNHRTTDKL